ncbi:DegT/DnrJ/EryC1/StrS family aminotransferase [Aminithiophilus ramosus]|uniref:DegT/DnrJ/EryC1/StrS family aminotransferase n=1 Tax=Aminithiophilus ramosus TaxID=3029084 RepID=A0A9Q7EWG5_9BACT|nr:DegT/DnrJ/EryC1/StrS family aminotransferase [Aminithiophilus ramosus]QTX31615.1 DegT/DnrJ/EryC1/StrS family aminotransferase [Aminithiophilus ramosus]
MPGFDLFDQREIDALADVINRKMVHRYSFNDSRDGIYRVEEFERAVAERVGARHALAVSSGSASLYVAMKACGIGPGDEIITTPFTFIASVEAILECGAVPVLAEVDESLNLDPESVEPLITERTKAVMPVHMFGAAADMEAYGSLCADHGLSLFEDSCQAMGATYRGKAAGTFGLWGTYSLDPYKIITVGEGGLIVTDDEELYRRMEYYHDHGHIHDKSIDRGAEGKFCLGFNFRMSELQGALGLVQLSKLDGALARLKGIKRTVVDAVADLGLSRRVHADAEGDSATQIVFLLPDEASARRFQKASKEAGVGCGNLSDNTWHYARHWRTLAEALPDHCTVERPRTHAILSRTAVYGLSVAMTEEQVEKTVRAIRAGAAAL